MKNSAWLISAALGLASLSSSRAFEPTTYGKEVAFLKSHLALVELVGDHDLARVVVVPAYQGRIMTSTAQGSDGKSFGWINHELIASGELRAHMNAFGGENRIWLGPEGGPFALFFAKTAPAQSLQYWQTPALFDSLPWSVTRQNTHEVALAAAGQLTNRAGTVLNFALTRAVRVLGSDDAVRLTGGALPADVAWVGFETSDRLVNSGSEPWRKETGLPSIWILGQFQPGPQATIVAPIVTGAQADLGPPVHSDFFGEIPADRLKVGSSAVFLRADGLARGKIGISPRRAKHLVGSWDAAAGVLTIVEFNLPDLAGAHPYVDSRWIDTDHPYGGDAVNAYNDGPPAPGVAPLGPFYELETSSPAAELSPGQSLTHVSRTYHFTGGRASLDALAQTLLGATLDSVEKALPASP